MIYEDIIAGLNSYYESITGDKIGFFVLKTYTTQSRTIKSLKLINAQLFFNRKQVTKVLEFNSANNEELIETLTKCLLIFVTSHKFKEVCHA